MSESHEDSVYIQRALDGDRDEFRVLVERYHRLVFRIAYSMIRNPESARDVVQEVFYRAYKSLHTYKPEQPFGAWIRRITVNYILDLRKKKNIPVVSMTMEQEDVLDIPDSQYDPRKDFKAAERNECVLNAVHKLPEKYRVIILLRHFENLTYEEISETLSIPLGTVMTHLHRARNKLAEILTPIQNELLS